MDWSRTAKRNVGSLEDGQIFKHFGTEFTRKELNLVKNYVTATWGKENNISIFHPETIVVVPRNVDIRTENRKTPAKGK